MEDFKLNIDTSIYKIEVTYYPRAVGKDEQGRTMQIDELITKSSTSKYHAGVARLRSITSKKQRDEYKIKFPAYSPHSIMIGGSSKSNITNTTNLLLCDWDFENSDDAKRTFPIIAGVLKQHLIFNRFSISGTGIHTLLLIADPDRRAEYFEKIDERFASYGLKTDSAFRSPVQKAIISSGEGQILNERPTPFDGSFHDVSIPVVVSKSAVTRSSKPPDKDSKKGNPVKETVDYLKSKYTVVRDSLTGNIKINGQLLNDSLIATLIMDSLLHGFAANKDLITAWVKSDFVKVEHRFDEFMKKHSDMRPRDAIKTLAKSLILESQPSTYPNFLEDCLRLWLVKMIAQMYEPLANELTIFFIGPQNIGKSYFFSHLLPNDLKDLFAEISFKNDKDFKVACTKYILIIDDEIKSRIQDIDFVKSLLTSPFVNVRKVYDLIDYNYKRIASFCGTSNDPQLLSDPSGNRRFCCFLLKQIDRDIYASVNKAELFVEAYNLYKEGYPLEAPKELLAAIQENSRQFEVLSLAEEILIDHYPPADPEVDNASEWFWWPVHHLVEQINSKMKTKVKEYHVGLALKKLKYKSKYAQVGRSKLRVFAVRPTLGQDWGEINDGPVKVLPPL